MARAALRNVALTQAILLALLLCAPVDGEWGRQDAFTAPLRGSKAVPRADPRRGPHNLVARIGDQDGRGTRLKLGRRLKRPQIVGFSHMFDGNNGKLEPIVREMHANLAKAEVYSNISTIFYTIIGQGHATYNLPIANSNAKYVRSKASGPAGFEDSTLDLLWEHCKTFPQDLVFYQHSKGSYHDEGGKNGPYRRLNHGGITAPCCPQSLLAGEGNVCGWHLAWAPYFHIPGNMWWARCDYIKKLPKPSITQHGEKIAYLGTGYPDCQPWRQGSSRWHVERWISMHPSFQMIDTLPSMIDKNGKMYSYGYDRLPKEDYPQMCASTRVGKTPEMYTPQSTGNRLFSVEEQMLCQSQTHKIAFYAAYFGKSWVKELTPKSTACLWFRRMALTMKYQPSRLYMQPYDQSVWAEQWLHDWEQHPAVRRACMGIGAGGGAGSTSAEPFEQEPFDDLARMFADSGLGLKELSRLDISGFDGAFCSRCLPVATTCHHFCSGVMGHDTGTCTAPASTDPSRCCECHSGADARNFARLSYGATHTAGEFARSTTQLAAGEKLPSLDKAHADWVYIVLQKMPKKQGDCTFCMQAPASCKVKCYWLHCDCARPIPADAYVLPCTANDGSGYADDECDAAGRESRQLRVQLSEPCKASGLHKRTRTRGTVIVCPLKPTVLVKDGTRFPLVFSNPKGGSIVAEKVVHWAWGDRIGDKMYLELSDGISVDQANNVLHGHGRLKISSVASLYRASTGR